MIRLVRLTIAGLVLLLGGATLSWGGPPNPTVSDAAGNTAGGTDALRNVTPVDPILDGSNNTAFGRGALEFTTTGSYKHRHRLQGAPRQHHR